MPEKIRNLLESVRNVGKLIFAICGEFQVSEDKISLTLDEDVGIVFRVSMLTSELANVNYSSEDFLVFCKDNNLHGLIFFGKNAIITFAMNVNVAPKVSKFPETLTFTIPEDYSEPGQHTVPHPTEEEILVAQGKALAPHNNKYGVIPAIKMYRTRTNLSLVKAKFAIKIASGKTCR